MEVLQWAHANGCSWDWTTCNAAAAKGHLKVLKWARTNLCPWGARSCLAAASTGIPWAKPHDWPWVFNRQISVRKPDVVLWIIKSAQLDEFGENALWWGVRVASREDDAECFEMLRAYWTAPDNETPLLGGPRCARLARASGVKLHPESEEGLRRVLDRQVAAVLVLRDRLP